ncbi:MAG TPA: ABC transporter ATP-binding protein [Vicinamibacteria bacterium]
MDAPKGDLATFRRSLRYARPYALHLAGLFLLSLLAAPLALLAPLPLAMAVNTLSGQGALPAFLAPLFPAALTAPTERALVFACALFILVRLLAELQALAYTLLRAYVGERMVLDLRASLFRHAQRLSLAYHDRKGTADTNYRIQSDAGQIQQLTVDGVIPVLTATLTLAGMVSVTAKVDPLLAGIALGATPVLALVTWAYRRRLRERWREVKSQESRALSVVQEALTSIRVVKAFGQEEREGDRFATRAGAGMQARLRVTLVDGSFSVATGLVVGLSTAAVLLMGGFRVHSGAMSLGSLVLVTGYLTQLYGPLYTVIRQVSALQSALAGAERAFSLLDQRPDVVERKDARPLSRARGAVAFEDVTFGYERERPVLRGVTFRAEPGARVGISGRTGEGKTTLMSLLTRFYDPVGGRILLDGIDLREYRVADLRSQFAIVLQDPLLFSTTIGENIAYGRPGATTRDIVAAAEAAEVHDFIRALPDGYDTPVGERGMTLSGGERQRISLARAFLKDAPVLILDEPTSSVDVRTEQSILSALDRLMEGRTTFMIAHRLSTLERCSTRLHVAGSEVSAAGGDDGGRSGVRRPSLPVP